MLFFRNPEPRPGGALLRSLQVRTLVLLFSGYAGFYLCRSNLSVIMPLLAKDLKSQGWDADEVRLMLGKLVSLGTFGYAVGKFISGPVTDSLGGRRTFLGGMTGTIFFTFLFVLGGGMPLFTLAWIGNRLVQSLGWPGMVKISSRWYSSSSYGMVMGVLSLSYLFGDALARKFLGALLGWGLGWPAVFASGAVILFFLLLLGLFLLKDSPADLGLPAPPGDPLNLYGDQGERIAVSGLRALLMPLFRSGAFWCACLLSLGCTLLRETFNTWTPTYFTESLDLTPAEAASTSALFPLFGGLSVLLAGFLNDRIGRQNRALLIATGLLLAGVALLGLGCIEFGDVQLVPIVLVALVGFLLLGPYSYLAGAVALDLGGKQAGATACGFIDGVGYLGAILAGMGVAKLTVHLNWSGAFVVLACVAWGSALAGVVYWVVQRRQERADARTV
jgi:sugar phosphate permease